MKREWIIFFGEDWGRHPSTGQYLAAELARSHGVLWVNSLGLREPTLRFSDLRRVVAKLGDFLWSMTQRARASNNLPVGLHVAAPLVIPFHRYTPVRVFNKTVLCWQLRKKARQLGLENPIVITACPSTAYVIRALDAKARIYYCADEHSALAGMDAELVQKLENELLTKVDLVVVSSKALEAAKGKLHPKVRYLPHGVDLNVFSPAANGSLKRPNDMAGFSQPIVGFVGSMGAHIDFELVQYAAEQLPGVTFVMVGPVEPDTTPPGGMPNLRFLGPKSHDEVPQYLAHFDVCIIPWRQTTRNRYASPTKLREYLAAGCSVVTTPHGETMVAEGPILYAETKESFAEMIARALDGEIGMSRKEISALMRKHTWRRRAGALLTTIEECTTAQAEQPTGLPWQTS